LRQASPREIRKGKKKRRRKGKIVECCFSNLNHFLLFATPRKIEGKGEGGKEERKAQFLTFLWYRILLYREGRKEM